MSTDNSMGPSPANDNRLSAKPPPLPPFAAPPLLANYAYARPAVGVSPAKNRKRLIIAVSLVLVLIAGITIVIGTRRHKASVAESREQMRRDAKAAYGPDNDASGEPVEAAAIRAAANSFFTSLKAGNQTAALNLLDAERLVEEMKATGGMPRLSSSDEAGFITGMKRGLAQGMSNGLGDLDKIEIRKVKSTSRNEAQVFLRAWHPNGARSKLRWFLCKSSGKWSIYDLEDLDGGMRASSAMAAIAATVMPGGSRSGGNMQWVADNRILMRSIGELGNRDLDAAEKSLASIDATKFPAPIDALRWTGKGILSSGRGKYPEALASYDKAQALNPDMPILDYLRAVAYNGMGKPEKAIEAGQKNIAALGDDVQAYREIGVAYEKLHQMDKAAEVYRKGFDDDPADMENLASLARALPQERKGELADVLFKTTNRTQAFKTCCAQIYRAAALEKLVDAYKPITANPTEPELLYQQARVLFLHEKWTQAAAFIKPLLQSVPKGELARFRALFLNAALAGGNVEDAYATLSANGNRRAIFQEIASDLEEDEDVKNLRKLLAVHTVADAKDPLLPLYSGVAFMMEKDFAKAAGEFKRAVSVAPDDETRQENQSRYREARYRAGEGVAAYTEAVPADRHSAFIQLAELAYQNGNLADYSKMLDAQRESLIASGDFSWWEARGDYLKKDYDAAVKILIPQRKSLLAKEQYRLYDWRNITLRSLVRLNRFADASALLDSEVAGIIAQSSKQRTLQQTPQSPASILPLHRLMIAACAHDPSATRKLLESNTQWLLRTAYEDEDIAPALRHPAMAAVVKSFPKPPPYAPATQPAKE